MVFKKIIFQNSLMANETPSRPPRPFMANAILNFHFDFWHPSLSEPRDFFQASLFEKWRSNMGRHFHRTYLKDTLLPFEFWVLSCCRKAGGLKCKSWGNFRQSSRSLSENASFITIMCSNKWNVWMKMQWCIVGVTGLQREWWTSSDSQDCLWTSSWDTRSTVK